jgi:peptidoglycan/LPS O-acetylase OafA/YrhL
MAQHWDFLVTRATQLLENRTWVGWCSFVAALFLIMSHWLVAGWVDSFLVRAITLPFILVGVCALVLLAETFPPLIRFFSSRIVAWLGLISFSLYLVHEPIIIGAAFLTHGAVWAVLIAVVVSFVVAQLFYMFVERPIHKFSQRLRRGKPT